MDTKLFARIKNGLYSRILHTLALSIFAGALMAGFMAITAAAEYNPVDVSGYLGRTVEEVYRDFPDFWTETDQSQSGREYLTNGRVCFFYEYALTDDDNMFEKKINRIVLNDRCGSEFRIGGLSGGATYGDEYAGLTGMGYEFLYTTGDNRHIWMDEEKEHLIIVTRGPWASACEIDYSEVISEDFWE